MTRKLFVKDILRGVIMVNNEKIRSEKMQKDIEIIKDGLSYNEELECIAKRFGMTQEQALKTIVEEVYNSEASSLGFSLKDALDLIHNCDCRFSECGPSQDVPF